MKKKEFLEAVDTLKLYRRAELVDEQGQRLISKLYVDPLPDEHVLQTLLKPSTTFLIGRKGTGKSTIFQRVQESLNSNKQATWAYIDIKTLYEASTSEIVGGIPPEFETALSPETIQKLCIFKSFVLDLINEIKNQIRLRVSSSLWNKVKEAFSGSVFELFEKLDEFVEELKRDQYLDVTGTIQASKKDDNTHKESIKTAAEATVKISADPSLQAKMLAELFSEYERKRSLNYSQVFIKVFNIRGLISRLREILLTLNLKHLYIFIDDSERVNENETPPLII